MFLLFLQICFSAGTTKEDKPSGISEFVIYAGRLIYNDTNDAGCIACDGSCTEENALKLADYGVVGFTWTKDSHICSLHVLEKEYDLAEAMVIYNGFDWVEENKNNTGPLYLYQYPRDKDQESLNAMCYYGILIQGTRNIASEVNTTLIGVVVVIMITWNG